MSIEQMLEHRQLPLTLIDYTQWPKVDIKTIKKSKRERFKSLRQAAQLYCKGDDSLRSAGAAADLPHTVLNYFLDRALQIHPDGRINGERAFVKCTIRADYTPSGDPTKGFAGKFKQLKRDHPAIKEIVKASAFKGHDIFDTHKLVKAYLYENGFTDDDYPLNTDSQGIYSIMRLKRDLTKKYFRQIARAQGGEDAARRADSSRPQEIEFLPDRPYQRIELDGHTLHAMFSIDIEELDGTIRTVNLKRLVIIAGIDASERTILGYRICMNAQPTIEDVALTVAHILDPMDESAPDILGYETGRGFGLPDRFIEKLRYRCFNELALDNALAHTSPALHSCLMDHVCNVVNLGKSKHPEGRALIEGWFKELNRYVARKLPSTTGSDPKDPARRDPAGKAKRYKISLADLEVLIEKVIRTYNEEGTDTTTGRSPLTKLEHHLRKTPGLVRKLRPEDRSLDFLFKRYFPATIAGSVARGDRPYIQFKDAIYRNQALSAMGPLIRTKVTLKVDIRDLRVIEAFLPSGESIGFLHAQGPWGRTPHSLQTRQAVLRHRRRERVRGRIHDWVLWYVEEILSRKKWRADTPNNVVRIRNEIDRGRQLEAEGHADTATDKPDDPYDDWIDIGPDIDL